MDLTPLHFDIYHLSRSPGPHAPSWNAWASSLDATSWIQWPPSSASLWLPANPSASSPCPEAPRASSRAYAGSPIESRTSLMGIEKHPLAVDSSSLFSLVSFWTTIPVGQSISFLLPSGITFASVKDSTICVGRV